MHKASTFAPALREKLFTDLPVIQLEFTIERLKKGGIKIKTKLFQKVW
jgi:hypothetical protein